MLYVMLKGARQAVFTRLSYFARFDSLVDIVAHSQEKSRSLSFAPFLARYRSLSLSLRGLT